MFEISPKVYSSMFSLPTEIADKGLKFATGDQLKVIIAIFRNPEITNEEITKKTNLSLEVVNECVEYWVDNGILKNEKSEELVKTEKQVAKQEQPKMPLPEIRFTMPTQEEINAVLKKNGAVNRLFNEAQEILGKTLGYTMQCTIYCVVYQYGITPDVANCLIHFAKSIDNTSQNDILKIAKYWAENGITDLSSADDYINEAEKALNLFRELANRTNNDSSMPTFAVLDLFCEWIRFGFTIDEVQKAFDIMKAEKQTGRLVWKNVTHMNGTIKNWKNQGTFTVEDIEKGTKKFQTKAQKTKEEKETSFDVELAEKMSREHLKDFSTKKKKRKKKEGA